MKKIVFALIILLIGCTQSPDLNSDKNVNDKNNIDLNQDINFDKAPEERMMSVLEKVYNDIWDNPELPEQEFSLGECKGKIKFSGEGIINIGGGWNQEVDYYNFIYCEGISLNELSELRKEEETQGNVLDKNVSVKETEFNGKKILVKSIKIELNGIIPHEQMHYFDAYEFRYFNCEGVILEGISRIYGNDDWQPRKKYFVQTFEEMVSQCS